MVFGTTLETIPRQNPYLSADSWTALIWKHRMSSANLQKVGVVWCGSATHPNDGNRSMPGAALAPLTGVEGVDFYSLQKEIPATDEAKLPGELKLIDWTAELSNFADTAALIANLDCVITVDTAVAHLAGAMGKPVWLLLPHVPDWRWLLARQDSPWYPSMRLLRQTQPGDWEGMIQKVCSELTRIGREMASKAQKV